MHSLPQVSGWPAARSETVHKLARPIYAMLSKGQECTDQGPGPRRRTPSHAAVVLADRVGRAATHTGLNSVRQISGLEGGRGEAAVQRPGSVAGL